MSFEIIGKDPKILFKDGSVLPPMITAWIPSAPAPYYDGLQARIEGDGLQIARFLGPNTEKCRIWLNKETWQSLVEFVNHIWEKRNTESRETKD